MDHRLNKRSRDYNNHDTERFFVRFVAQFPSSFMDFNRLKKNEILDKCIQAEKTGKGPQYVIISSPPDPPPPHPFE